MLSFFGLKFDNLIIRKLAAIAGQHNAEVAQIDQLKIYFLGPNDYCAKSRILHIDDDAKIWFLGYFALCIGEFVYLVMNYWKIFL